MSSEKTRPTGVTILAVLELIGSVVYIGFGAFMGALGGMMGTVDGWAAGLISAVFVGLGLVGFVMAWGLLKGKTWAWTITLILTVIGLIISIPSFNIIGLIINGIILYYLFRPHVKSFFGKQSAVL